MWLTTVNVALEGRAVPAAALTAAGKGSRKP